jgi:hypothetical protein
MPSQPVPRVRIPLSELLLAPLDERDTPLIFEGLVSDWAATRQWSPARLTARIGHVTANFKQSTCHQHPDFHRSELREMFARRQSTFAEFFTELAGEPNPELARRLFTGDEQYLMRRRDGVTSIDEALKPLLEDVQLERLLPEERLYTVWAWFSGRGVRTWLHYDNNGCHNFNAQLQGEKRCSLFSPSALAAMAPFALGAGNPAHNCSSRDIELELAQGGIDHASVTSWDATLRQGDLLFIPAWWWHSFEHVGAFNANVNVWWKPTRPCANATATRQAWLEAVTRAELGAPPSPAVSDVLRRVDEQMIAASAG